MNPSEESRSLDLLVDRLGERFPQIPQQTIREVVSDAHHDFDGAPIRDFVPVLVEHEALGVLKERTTRSSS